MQRLGVLQRDGLRAGARSCSLSIGRLEVIGENDAQAKDHPLILPIRYGAFEPILKPPVPRTLTFGPARST
jgi:hypothetical protein